MQLTLERLAKILSQNFAPPFLPKGTVNVKICKQDGEKVLSINIGARDIQINAAGEVVSSGTML